MTLWEEEDRQTQEEDLKQEEKLKVPRKSVNKNLYKVFLLILKAIPFILAINETLFTILRYYDINCYNLSIFRGFSVLFIVTLYLLSYIFRYCKWHRIPLHYVCTVNMIAYYDEQIGIPISDLQMLRVYLIIAGISLISFIYFKIKDKC